MASECCQITLVKNGGMEVNKGGGYDPKIEAHEVTGIIVEPERQRGRKIMDMEVHKVNKECGYGIS